MPTPSFIMRLTSATVLTREERRGAVNSRRCFLQRHCLQSTAENSATPAVPGWWWRMRHVRWFASQHLRGRCCTSRDATMMWPITLQDNTLHCVQYTTVQTVSPTYTSVINKVLSFLSTLKSHIPIMASPLEWNLVNLGGLRRNKIESGSFTLVSIDLQHSAILLIRVHHFQILWKGLLKEKFDIYCQIPCYVAMLQ